MGLVQKIIEHLAAIDHGNPNGPGLPVWPEFEPKRRAYMHFIDATPVAKNDLRHPFCDLYMENLKRR
jgi:carboxylesterase type B